MKKNRQCNAGSLVNLENVPVRRGDMNAILFTLMPITNRNHGVTAWYLVAPDDTFDDALHLAVFDADGLEVGIGRLQTDMV